MARAFLAISLVPAKKNHLPLLDIEMEIKLDSWKQEASRKKA